MVYLHQCLDARVSSTKTLLSLLSFWFEVAPLLFGNNRKLVRLFAVVNSAVEYWILSHKRFLHAKIIN